MNIKIMECMNWQQQTNQIFMNINHNTVQAVRENKGEQRERSMGIC